MLMIIALFVLSIPAIILILWLINTFTKSPNIEKYTNAPNSTTQAVSRLKAFFEAVGLSVLYFFSTFVLNLLFHQWGSVSDGWGALALFIYGLLFSLIAVFVFYLILTSVSKSKRAIIISIFVVSFCAIFLLISAGAIKL
jgi:hypothetical protein